MSVGHFRHSGLKRLRGRAAEMMAAIVALRQVDQLERAGFVVKKPPAGGGASISRGIEGR